MSVVPSISAEIPTPEPPPVTVIFALLYLFVTLFSQNFHNHGSGEVFKDFNFKKSEKTYTKGNFAQ